ncbi:hypothetical protein LY474_28520 [Myxococcus stipitatus]|uniref:DUF6968 family protein n=1 Tax=Myxococcus stipitatus TaxID=83455 RepID=UPI001F2F4159|nr:hypothetical protein [Myxococcus stipitatus]MCE9671759.1 hypothetical protein [Myxococcus stipitatus]
MSTGLPQLTSIDDPIAEDVWSYETESGTQVLARVVVGRPVPIPGDPNGDWYCPLLIEQPQDARLLPVPGVGPVDALKNAMQVVGDAFRDARKLGPRAKSPATP